MTITEVTIKLAEGTRLRAFCTIVIDNEFLIRDLRIIETRHGLFVSMPSRKIADHCPDCGMKNAYTAVFCNNCGRELPDIEIPKDDTGREKLYADVCHPIVPECREKLQKVILEAYRKEKERCQKEQSETNSQTTEEGLKEREAAYGEANYDGPTDFSFRDSGTNPNEITAVRDS
jgi:stage V sporulation protein G